MRVRTAHDDSEEVESKAQVAGAVAEKRTTWMAGVKGGM